MSSGVSSSPPPSSGGISQRARLYRAVLPLVLGVVLLGSIIYLLVLALGGAHLIKASVGATAAVVTSHDARPWLIAAAGAALLTLLGWAVAERKLSSLIGIADSERAARAAQAETQRRLDEAERERDAQERAREEEHDERERVARNANTLRDWNKKLRDQIARMQQQHGLLGRHDDVREMVLELTMYLAEAEKGILLSERHQPDGKLQVVCALGFENDPAESAIAQRFASKVIERDTTIREDSKSRVDSEKRGPADQEVKNLLAIPVYVLDDFEGVIICANRDGGFEELEDEVLLAVGDHAGAVLQNARLHGNLRSAYLATIRVLADAIELKDPGLRGHSDAVSEYVLGVANQLEFEPRRREALIFASLLHDVGKLGISERILLKPAKLTDEERSVIELHPRIGYQLIRQVPALEDIAPAVLHHHERFDGDGYPGRLRGETIPLESRIIAVADAFSAMTTDRPYSSPRTYEEACVELERCAGAQFDPEVVRLFVGEVRRKPPEQLETPGIRPDPELEVHIGDGEFVLGGRSFGITDSLTMLYSHRHFHESVRAEAQRGALQDRPFGIVVAQLVDIQEINSARGFAAGDAVLQSVAQVVQRIAARHGGLGFRVSGRRLALLLPGVDQATVERIAETLLQEVNSAAELSVAATSWRPGEDGEQVIERALRTARDSVGAAS